MMKISKKNSIYLIISIFYFILLVSLKFRIFNFSHFLQDWNEKTILGSVLVYWIFTLLVIFVIQSWKSKKREILLSLFSLGIALILAEIVLRIFFPLMSLPRPTIISNPYYHHIYQPNQKMFAGYCDGIPVLFQTNTDGMRTKYSREEFLKHKTRIAIMGDSFVFGLGVPQDSLFTERMEKILQDKTGNQDIAILNAGITSFSPLLEKYYFEKVVKEYKPQVILLLLDATDIGDDYHYGKQLVQKENQLYFRKRNYFSLGYYGAVMEIFLKPWILNPLLYPVNLGISSWDYSHGDNYYDFEITIDGHKETNRFFIYRYPLEKTRKYFDQTMHYIQDIRDETKTNGSNFILVITPRYHHWNPKESPHNWESIYYSNHEPYQYEYFKYFDEKAGKVDFKILDILPSFQSTKEYPIVFAEDPHWNIKGHQFVANLLSKYILDNKIVKN